MKDNRDRAILERIREQRVASVVELAEATSASIPTIRRDLQRLHGAGLLRRTHGGAVAIGDDSPFAEVEAVNLVAKQSIASRAATLVADGDSVLLDIGTTTAQLARALRGRRLTVVTPSLKVWELLRDDREIHVILLPGDYDPVYYGVSGPMTTECLRMVQVDHAFLGVSGIADNGDLRDTTIAQLPIKRAIAAVAERRTVLADATKFPGRGAGRLEAENLIDAVITDAPIPATTAAAYDAVGIEVVLA